MNPRNLSNMTDHQGINVRQLAYLGIAATDLAAWRGFAGQYLGMQVLTSGQGTLALRMDERRQRMLVNESEHDGLAFLGFELQDPQDLHAARCLLSEVGFITVPATTAELELRGVTDMFWFQDPDGNRIELFHGPLAADQEFAPARITGGFRTGNLGFGHVVLMTPNFPAMKRLFVEHLGFRVSDYLETPVEGVFMHLNARHHSVAIISAPEPGLHHVMVEYNFVDDVGRLYDMALQEPERVAVTLGRHTNDHMFSFYSKTPGGFLIETGWAGRLIDDGNWTPVMLSAPSIWGHERYWLPPAAREETRRKRDELSRLGVLAPTEVVPSPGFKVVDEQPKGGLK